MRLEPECCACIMSRALHDADLAGASRDQKLEIARRVALILARAIEKRATPAEVGTDAEFVVHEVTGNRDPYAELKRRSNEVAREVLSKLGLSPNPSLFNFRRVAHVVAAANAIEFGIHGYLSSEEILGELERVLDAPLAIDHRSDLWVLTIRARTVLYVLDNAGEALFDLLFCQMIKRMGRYLIVAARAAPVLNDVTVDEARELGFDEVADEIVPVGHVIGIPLESERLDPRFRRAWEDASLVIAKGMGAYETLSDARLSKPTFVLLKAKCEPVARSLGVRRGSLCICRLA